MAPSGFPSKQSHSSIGNENVNPLAPSPKPFDLGTSLLLSSRNSSSFPTLIPISSNNHSSTNLLATKAVPIPATPPKRNSVSDVITKSHMGSPSPRTNLSRIKNGSSCSSLPHSRAGSVGASSPNKDASRTRSLSRSSIQLSGSRFGSPAKGSASYTSLSNTAMNDYGSNGIKVIARFRPETTLNSDIDGLLAPKDQNIIDFRSDTSVYFNSREQTASFTFDRVFPPEATQQDIYEYSIHETVADVFQGYNGTILAYGQTGSGKTYTMMGSDIDDPERRGLIPRIANTIFDLIRLSSSDIEYTVSVSYMEIYMEKIRDLLDTNNKNLTIHEDKEIGVHVKGLQRMYVTSPEDLHKIMKEGTNSRAVASTNMNQESSRSHAIFQVIITQKVISSGITKRGNLFLVDLAGSEKVARTGASGQTLEEAKKINSSLSLLGHVIHALTDGKAQHVPYRDSKLTRILQESLGGNSRTSLIINCSASASNASETLSTLRFGARAKKIKNKPHINTELSSKELVKLVDNLARELRQWRSGAPPTETSWIDLLAYEKHFPLLQQDRGSASQSTDAEITEDILGELSNDNFEDLSNDHNYEHLNGTILTGSNHEDLAKENAELKKQLANAQKSVNDQTLNASAAKNMRDMEAQIADQKFEIDYLKSQLGIEKLSNAALVNDIKDKTTRCVSLDLEVESLKSQLRKKALSRTEKQKILALEKTLDQFAHKLDEMLLQNSLLKKDIATTRRIAETRNEKIRTLEGTIKEQNNQVHKESYSFEKRLDRLSQRLNAAKKASLESKSCQFTSPTSQKLDYSVLLSPRTPMMPERPEEFVDTSTVGRNASSQFFESDQTPKNHQPETVNFQDRAKSLLVYSPDLSSFKKGLDFRIVKPLRGGNGTQVTNEPATKGAE